MARHREEVQDELHVTLSLTEPSPRRRGAWDCLDHAQGQSLSSSTDGSFFGPSDIAGQFKDLLPLPPWDHLAVSITDIQACTGQHEVVGNMCCPDNPSLVSSEAAANGVVEQPEPDPAHHHLDHSRLGTVSKGNQRGWHSPAAATRKARSPTNSPTTL